MALRPKLIAQTLAVAAVVGLLALLIWKITHNGGGVGSAVAKGERPPAPNFTLGRLDRSGRLALSSLRGKVVVLNFWASWCEPCKAESPRLQAAWERFRKRGVVVLGVDSQDFSGDAKDFMKRFALTYPVVHDGSGSTLKSYSISGFPETYFIARDGRIVGSHIEGAVTEDALAENIAIALAQ